MGDWLSKEIGEDRLLKEDNLSKRRDPLGERERFQKVTKEEECLQTGNNSK